MKLASLYACKSLHYIPLSLCQPWTSMSSLQIDVFSYSTFIIWVYFFWFSSSQQKSLLMGEKNEENHKSIFNKWIFSSQKQAGLLPVGPLVTARETWDSETSQNNRSRRVKCEANRHTGWWAPAAQSAARTGKTWNRGPGMASSSPRVCREVRERTRARMRA